MDGKELKELMEYISTSNFVEFEIEKEGFKLKLVKEAARAAQGNHSAPAAAPGPAQTPAPAQAPLPAPGGSAAERGADVFQVTSPMVGTFYRSSNPASAPFVEVGDVVRKGQVICILEAMKLMNEIESEVSGEILEIPVSNGQPVEYGEVLFRIRLTS